MGVRLPAEYQEVEYIEGARGTQYINTGIAGNDDNLVIEAKVKPGSYVQYCSLWGNYANESSNVTRLIASSPTAILPYINQKAGSGVYTVNCGAIFGTNKIFTIRQSKDSIEIDGISYEVENRATGTENNNPIAINAARTVNPVQENTTQQFYYFRIFSSEVMLIDLIPCYRKSNNEPGMYDLVSKSFFTNQGTGEFLVGPDVVNHISPRLMDRRRVLIAKLTSLFKNIISSETGLASFNTNFAKPMKVTCEFSPKQDLHGYDNPWPAGGGKNLFMSHAASDTVNGVTFTANSDGTVTVNGTATADIIFTISEKLASSPGDGTYCHLSDIGIVAGNLYILNGCPSGGNTGGYRLQLLVYGSGSEPSDSGTGSSIFTFSESDVSEKWYRLAIRVYNGTVCNNLVFKPMIRLSSVSDASYAPYENICPIESWDGANVIKAQRNLLNPDDVQLVSLKLDNSIQTRQGVMFQKAGKYCIKPFTHPNNNVYFYAKRYEKNGTWGSDRYIVAAGNNYNVEITINDGDKLYLFNALGQSAEMTKNTIIDFQITCCLDEYAETYEPYCGITLPIPFNNPGTYDFLPVQEGTGDPSPENVRPITPGLTFTRDDNTTLEVWGGSLTVNADGTGSLTTAYYNLDCKSIDWIWASGASSGAVYFCNRTSADIPECAYGPGQIILSKALEKYSHGVIDNPYDQKISCAWVFTTTARIGFADGSNIDTIEKFNTWLNDQEVCQIVYPLATPTTYTLSVAETSRAFEALGLGKNLGPLYGGTVTINEDRSCDIVSSWAIRDLGELTYTRIANPTGTLSNTYIFASGTLDPLPKTAFRCIVSKYNGVESYRYMSDNCTAGYIYNTAIAVRDDNYTDASSFKTAVSGYQLAYELASQQTYHFSSIADFKSFIGSNNIWSDLNGPITVEYYNNKKE